MGIQSESGRGWQKSEKKFEMSDQKIGEHRKKKSIKEKFVEGAAAAAKNAKTGAIKVGKGVVNYGLAAADAAEKSEFLEVAKQKAKELPGKAKELPGKAKELPGKAKEVAGKAKDVAGKAKDVAGKAKEIDVADTAATALGGTGKFAGKIAQGAQALAEAAERKRAELQQSQVKSLTDAINGGNPEVIREWMKKPGATTLDQYPKHLKHLKAKIEALLDSTLEFSTQLYHNEQTLRKKYFEDPKNREANAKPFDVSKTPGWKEMQEKDKVIEELKKIVGEMESKIYR